MEPSPTNRTVIAGGGGVRAGALSGRLAVVSHSQPLLRALGVACAAGGIGVHAWPGPELVGAEQLSTAGFGAVLVDQSAGVRPLVELIRELAGREGSPQVLALGDGREPGAREALLDAGAAIWVSKAIAPSALVVLIRELLRGNVEFWRATRDRAGGEHHAESRMSAPDSTATAAGVAPASGALAVPLTPRELEILRFVAAGMTNLEVAAKLWVTHQTVKFHLRNIYRKLGVVNRTQASNLAHRHGLVGPAVLAISDGRPAAGIAHAA